MSHRKMLDPARRRGGRQYRWRVRKCL